MAPTDQPHVEAILERLVAFDTVSVYSNLALCEYVISYLDALDIPVQTFPDASGTKCAMLATIGDPGKAGIVLSAHTDVVPVAGQNWSSPAFTATVVGDRIIGRGTSDMKGFIAAVLSNAALFKEYCRETPIHMAFSYDEEIGCRGADDLVTAVAGLPVLPALCLVGEPTSLRVGQAHKGKIARRISVSGRGGHSAMPHKAASALDAIVNIAAHLRRQAQALEKDTADQAFDPPYSTLHIGAIQSGDALNFVPDHATLAFEIRFLPGVDVSSLLRSIDEILVAESLRLQAKAAESRIVVEELAAYPALDAPTDVRAMKSVAAWAKDDRPAIPLSFGTEAGLYAATGVPTLVCGPGDIGRAHKANEWIGRGELSDACAMMRRLAEACRSPATEWLGA
jgi:acetylornithine deacetylase